MNSAEVTVRYIVFIAIALGIAFLIWVNLSHRKFAKKEEIRRNLLTQEQRDEEDYMDYLDRHIW